MANGFSLELQHLIQAELAAGHYDSDEELLLEAVRLLTERNRRRQVLRRELQIGREQLDRGEGIELDNDEALEAFLEEIAAEVNAELAAKKSGR